MNNQAVCATIEQWLDQWHKDPVGVKIAFVGYYTWLKKLPDVHLEFKARPGVSYSLRASRSTQTERPLFVLVDVVDDVPEERWLSVCFYADMVNDPEERGDFVPQGLLGNDACCLNLEEEDPAMLAYIQQRLEEAAKAAR